MLVRHNSKTILAHVYRYWFRKLTDDFSLSLLAFRWGPSTREGTFDNHFWWGGNGQRFPFNLLKQSKKLMVGSSLILTWILCLSLNAFLLVLLLLLACVCAGVQQSSEPQGDLYEDGLGKDDSCVLGKQQDA